MRKQASLDLTLLIKECPIYIVEPRGLWPWFSPGAQNLFYVFRLTYPGISSFFSFFFKILCETIKRNHTSFYRFICQQEVFFLFGTIINWTFFSSIIAGLKVIDLAPVVQKVDDTIHWINLYPVDNTIGFPNS